MMFLIVAEKSRTFSHLPYSASEQACRSWEGAQPGKQARAGQWKCSTPWSWRLGCEWGLAGGQESASSANSTIAAGGLAAQSVIGQWEKLYCAQLVLHILYYYYSFLCCFIKLSLSQPTNFTFHPFSSPSHRTGGKSKLLAPRLNNNYIGM